MEQVQFITHYTEKYSYLDSARMALAGGCRWIQLRMKDAGRQEILPVAAAVRRLCNEHGAVFIIDDHVELVREIGADGVHLGKNDMPVAEARRMLGSGYIIGGTANTYEDVKLHWLGGADYIGCGPFRYTTTKQKLSPILGLEGYKKIIRSMQAEHIPLPVVAIGGITFADIPSVMQTGVAGIALSGTVLRADNPAEEMRRVLAEIDRTKQLPKNETIII
ncbi:thiamine phosphate synthase [Bacteroides gallinarum]|uniref:thiamine phosphate synthase n=1 Tax=Bacteroides gallinarum TaxID=376806 RepID=UPI000370878C|nr:thiamine phosphate synthase [Bacteroides gallinarum]